MFALRAALGRFRPDYVPGLFGWWDASAGNVFDAQTGGTLVTTGNSIVRRLEDLSGNDHHLTGSGTSPAQARLQVGGNGQNGLPVLRRAGDFTVTNSLGSALDTNFGTGGGIGSPVDVAQPFTFIFAGKIGRAGVIGSGGGNGQINASTSGGARYSRPFVITNSLSNNIISIGSRYPGGTANLNTNRYAVAFNGGESGETSTGTALPLVPSTEPYLVLAVLIDGSNSRWSINGGTWTQFNAPNYIVQNLGILANPAGSSAAQNAQTVAELCLYEENISDADRISVVSYLMDKWDIS
jgi:hypothetical protein